MRLNQLLLCFVPCDGDFVLCRRPILPWPSCWKREPGGRIADYNLAGTVFMETTRPSTTSTGAVAMNGARFELTEPSGDMGPYVPLEGMDLRHSSWVAVDFLTPPVFRYTNASQANFSAIHMDGEPVEMVDATRVDCHQDQIPRRPNGLWYVQGANFDEAEFSSALLTTWTTDDLAYEGIFDPAPLKMRALTAEG